jgi:asparagine synthase (glutamine-hydrolysing)
MDGYNALQSLTTSISSACDYLLGNFDLFSKRHNKLLRFAQIQKKNQISFNGSNIYPKDIATTWDRRKHPQTEYTKKQNHVSK